MRCSWRALVTRPLDVSSAWREAGIGRACAWLNRVFERETKNPVGLARAQLVGLLAWASACNAKDAVESRIQIFADRHGGHLQKIAAEFAPRCPDAIAQLPPGGEAQLPGASGSQAALPFGSMMEDRQVQQIVVKCVDPGRRGMIMASLIDPFAEGGTAAPPSGCTEHAVTAVSGETLIGCSNPREASRISVELRSPAQGGSVEVLAISTLLQP